MEMFFICLLAFGIIGVIVQHFSKKKAEADRRNRIENKYGSSPARNDILEGRIRPGMTVQQLLDAWGPPAAIEERVLKTKIVHTYKYAQTGTRSFRQKVKVENGIVVGWTNV